MFNIILYQPEIPPNTGNIIRVCANTGTSLHLIKPLGFSLGHKHLLRAGLDYHESAQVKVHLSWEDCLHSLAGCRLFGITTRGYRRYDDVRYEAGDAFIFGPESRGLPHDILDSLPLENRIRIPMLPESRSLNLANAVAVVVYKAWEQLGFPGSK